MALILNLETSSEICSVCISKAGKILAIKESDEKFSHTRKITVFIQDILNEVNLDIKELDAVSVSHGPGSYTGLRVAASSAKGLCYGLDIPLISIPTLEAIANHTKNKYPGYFYAPMIDARRMEVYTCVYNENLDLIKETNNIILEEENLEYIKQGHNVIACGTGVEKAKKLLEDNGFITFPYHLSSSHLAEIAEISYQNGTFQDIVSYEPMYFKAPKVTQSKKPLF